MADLAFDAATGRVLVARTTPAPSSRRSATDPPRCSPRPRRRLFRLRRPPLTVFTDEEERTGGTGENTPWWVESALRERGAVIDSAAPWSDHVVIDGNLITGQNPQSSASVARRVLEALTA